MRSKHHFEMREYSIDVVNNEGDSYGFAKGRPYPIYPSKKGLNPDFFRDIISRSVSVPLSHYQLFFVLRFHISIFSSRNQLVFYFSFYSTCSNR